MIEAFKSAWGEDAVPEALRQLMIFQQAHSDFGCYAQGFGVSSVYAARDWLACGWCGESGFLQRIYCFARANSTGSVYALWDDGGGKPLAQMPVAVFGDEGGAYIVAENLYGLLQLIACDKEISADMDGLSFSDAEDGASADAPAYARWLAARFGLPPPAQPEEIAAAAQARYQAAFETWLAEWFDD